MEEEAITITLRDNEDFAKNIARAMLMMMIMLTMLMTMMVKCDKNILKDCNKFAVEDNDFLNLPNLTNWIILAIHVKSANDSVFFM